MSEQTEQVRPERGQIVREDGTVVPLAFVRDADDPTVFHAVEMDRAPVSFDPGRDKLWVDRVGPGQAVALGEWERGDAGAFTQV